MNNVTHVLGSSLYGNPVRPRHLRILVTSRRLYLHDLNGSRMYIRMVVMSSPWWCCCCHSGPTRSALPRRPATVRTRTTGNVSRNPFPPTLDPSCKCVLQSKPYPISATYLGYLYIYAAIIAASSVQPEHSTRRISVK